MTYEERMREYRKNRPLVDELAAMPLDKFVESYHENDIYRLAATSDDYLDAAIAAAQAGSTDAKQRAHSVTGATREALGMTLMAINAIESGDSWFVANT